MRSHVLLRLSTYLNLCYSAPGLPESGKQRDPPVAVRSRSLTPTLTYVYPLTRIYVCNPNIGSVGERLGFTVAIPSLMCVSKKRGQTGNGLCLVL